MPDNRVGSGFTNIQNILSANQNNQLGQAVGTGISQVGQQAKSDIGAANTQFQSDIGKEQTRQAGEQTEATNVIGQLGTGQTPSQQQISDFSNIRAGQYLGPQGLQNSQNLIGGAQTAQNLGQATSSMGGRQGLLQQFAGKGPNYTAGQQNMDALLLGQTGGQQLQQARQGVAGLGNYAQNQVGAAGQVVQNVQGQAKGLAQNVVGQLGTAVTGFDTAQQLAAQQAQAARQAAIQQYQTDLASGNLTQTEMNQLDKLTGGQFDPTKITADQLAGMTGGPYVQGAASQNIGLWGQDLSKYASMDQTQANQYNTLTAPQVAQINALQQLSGTSLTGAPSSTLSGYLGNEQQQGTLAATPLISAFNTNAAVQDVAANRAAYQHMVQNTFSPEMAAIQNAMASGQANPNAVAGNDVLANTGGLAFYKSTGSNPLAQNATNQQVANWLNTQLAGAQKTYGYGQNIQIRPDGTPVSTVTGS